MPALLSESLYQPSERIPSPCNRTRISSKAPTARPGCFAGTLFLGHRRLSGGGYAPPARPAGTAAVIGAPSIDDGAAPPAAVRKAKPSTKSPSPVIKVQGRKQLGDRRIVPRCNSDATSLQEEEANREAYDHIQETPFLRRHGLAPCRPSRWTWTPPPTPTCAASSRSGQLPPSGAVRVEELLNYFPYEYSPAQRRSTPWPSTPKSLAARGAPEHRLVRVGVQGRASDLENRQPANLVFLLDVSGSMEKPEQTAACSSVPWAC